MTYRPDSEEETSEISLRLDHYDDIFSDFDIRPYSKRALSSDFLDEIRRASRDKKDGGIELTLHVPEKERNESREGVIRERLTAHFGKHYNLTLKEKRSYLGRGIVMVILGTVFMITAALIMFKKDPAESLLLSFLIVFLEPAAWFLLWEGMDLLLFSSKEVDSELDFYRKISDPHGHIHFKPYAAGEL